MTIILTNCTNRKKGGLPPELTIDQITPGPLDYVAHQWMVRLKNTSPTKPARDVYCGRSFREAEESSLALGCNLYVVSTGLGVISADDLVPIYNLTITPGTPNSILSKVQQLASPRDWWSKIICNNPFGYSITDVLNKHPNELVLIALSSPYLGLIRDELLRCDVVDQNRIRIFGKNLDPILAETLSDNWMPYDDRLDGVSGQHSGTQTDFAQRALRHFASKILCSNEDGDTLAHRAMVLNALSLSKKRPVPNRRRLTDQELTNVLIENWSRGKGQSTALLKIVRRELNIACEQSRFRGLYHSVKNNMGDKS